MDDLISRQAAIDALKAIKYGLWEIDIPSPTVPEYVEHHEQIKNMMEIVDGWIERIQEEPPIQSKRGKWIKTARWGRVYYCDQCRNYLDFDGVNAGRGSTNFCPNCGAKMEVVT